jgi:hypothetical protein
MGFSPPYRCLVYTVHWAISNPPPLHIQADFAGPLPRCIGATNVSTCPPPDGEPEEHAQVSQRL